MTLHIRVKGQHKICIRNARWNVKVIPALIINRSRKMSETTSEVYQWLQSVSSGLALKRLAVERARLNTLDQSMHCCRRLISCSWQKRESLRPNLNGLSGKTIRNKKHRLCHPESSSLHPCKKAPMEFQCRHLCKLDQIACCSCTAMFTFRTTTTLMSVRVLKANLLRRKKPRKSVISQIRIFRSGKRNLNKTACFWPRKYKAHVIY